MLRGAKLETSWPSRVAAPGVPPSNRRESRLALDVVTAANQEGGSAAPK